MLLTFAVLLITIILFIWGKPRADVTALLSLLALYLTGIIDTSQALSGFGNSTVILIAALFIVGEGLTQTGLTSWLGARIILLSRRRPNRLSLWMMGIGAALSGFMSNTGAVAALMPAVVSAAWGVGSVPAKFLMSLSFAAMTGGLLTLMGTPPNVVVAEALSTGGFSPFGFFDFSLIGLPLVFVVMIYMVTIGNRLLPKETNSVRPVDLKTSLSELTKSYSLHGKLFRLRVRNQSPLDGKTLADAALGRDHEISVLHVERADETVNGRDGDGHHQVRGNGDEQRRARLQLDRFLHSDDITVPRGATQLQAGDVLLVRATQEIIERAQIELNFGVQPVDEDAESVDGALLTREIGLAEVLVTPRSEFIGKTLAESRFGDRYSVHVIGVRRHDQIAKRQRVKLDFGDSLLVRGQWDAIQRLAEDRRNFVVVGSPETMALQVPRLGRRAWVALGALAVMIVLMVSGLTPAVIAAMIASVVMVLGGAVPVQQFYRGISLQSVVLIAAMIPMSTALQVSGGARYLVDLIVNTLGSYPAPVLLLGIFMITSLLSQVISNTATTVLVAPLVLQAAVTLGLSPYPLMMMVVVGASTAFLTPIGTPTNLLVMSPGGYQFRHYSIVGLPLYVIFLIVALLVVPIIWPL